MTEAARSITEVPDVGPVPLYRHPEWAERFPWAVQGTTGRGGGEAPFDLGTFGAVPVGTVIDRWKQLRQATGMRTAIHARQLHGTDLGSWEGDYPFGLMVVEGLDGHVTTQPDLLLAVSIADCVPLFLLAESGRTIALVHAGWRGVAGGALESAVGELGRRGIDAADLWLHCGPSICGACYEVGPEVHQAVNPERPVPTRPTPIDLALALADRAARLGLHRERITRSTHCTLCGDRRFFSHRGGDVARQMGVLGLRP